MALVAFAAFVQMVRSPNICFDAAFVHRIINQEIASVAFIDRTLNIIYFKLNVKKIFSLSFPIILILVIPLFAASGMLPIS